MNRAIKILRFISWPVVCGVLVAVVYLQYQQLDQLRIQVAQASQSQPVYEPTTSFADAISKAAPSVVAITATRFDVESVERLSDDQLNLYLGEQNSLGSGVIVSADGFILTNLHVVDNLFDLFDTEVTLSDGRRIPATVVAWDKANDLAVLHINMGNLTPVEIGDVQDLEVGDIVFAIGYPRNIGQSVSQGIISAITNNPDQSVSILQTDAAINPGNSGGALIDSSGHLIGINSSIFSESGNFEGIGFATPASIAISSMEELVAQAIDANSGYLGVLTGEALDAQSSQLFFGVDHIRGMLVESVDDGGAAEQAGIRPGDVITRVEDTLVVDAENILMEIRNKKPGEMINIQVYRNGQTFNLPTTLGFGEARIIEPQASIN
ncbi:MAG: trypsin-like peptidase domain-containing protein [Gammaproteobacteria bacterium]|nr:trypsin-like peptidase domain-containing protein [Gammaproteobacteria bacterium]MDD9960279.1 trypsin-like peptidase domain-containing protein [Gammaproteobacteria bacterium]